MEIKKCPFCGKESQLRFYINYGSYGYAPNVYHLECECGAGMKLVDDFRNSNNECKDMLIKRWNDRK